MGFCRFDVDTFTYNVESNLAAMGLPMPDTVAGSMTTVSGALGAVTSALTSKASDVPLSAIAKSERGLSKVVGIGAAFWVGAVIGSAMMASKRATSCSRSEFVEAFRAMGIPVWIADDALRSPNSDRLLKRN